MEPNIFLQPPPQSFNLCADSQGKMTLLSISARREVGKNLFTFSSGV